MNESVVMKMDKETALLVEEACEFYSRVLCGQYSEISDHVMNNRLEKTYQEDGEEAMHKAFDDLIDARSNAEEVLHQARAIQFPELSRFAHYGFGYSKETDMAFGVYQALRYARSWHDHPEGGWTVNFDKPLVNYPIPEVHYEDSDEK